MATIWHQRNRCHALVPLSAAVAISLALRTARGLGHQLAANGRAPLQLAPVDLLVFAPTLTMK